MALLESAERDGLIELTVWPGELPPFGQDLINLVSAVATASSRS